MIKLCELRHLDEIKGNFGIGDGIYYRANAKLLISKHCCYDSLTVIHCHIVTSRDHDYIVARLTKGYKNEKINNTDNFSCDFNTRL